MNREWNIKKEKVYRYIFILVLFALEFSLFCSYAEREVIGKIPMYTDQVGYLNSTYKMYDLLINKDYREFISYGLAVSNNSGMRFVGVLFLCIFGYSRVSLLLPNFFAFFLMQLVVGHCIYDVSKSRCLEGITHGLILMVHTSFYHIGDLLDYRWDYIAFCFFTIWIAIMIIALNNKSPVMWYYSSIACGVLIFLRFNAVVYVVSILGVFLLTLIIEKEMSIRLVLNVIVKYVIGVIVGGGWFLLVNFGNFFNYYSYAYTSEDQVIWQLNLGFLENILFYPKLMVNAHLGKTLTIFIFGFLVLEFVWIGINKIVIDRKEKNILWLDLIALLLPLCILTVSKNKNDTVISIIDGVCVLMPMLILSIISTKHILFNVKIKYVKMASMSISLFCFLLGIGSYFLNCMSIRSDYSKTVQSGVVSISEAVTEYIHENDINNPLIIVDRVMDTMFTSSLNVFFYEKYGENANICYAMEGMPEFPVSFSFTEEELMEGLERTDFIVASEDGYRSASNYSVDILMDKYREQILQYAKMELEPLVTEHCSNGIVTVYARKQGEILVDTSWNDWLGVNNTSLYFSKDGMDTFLVLEGENAYAYENQMVECNYQGVLLPTEFGIKDEKYQLVIDISQCDVGNNKVDIKFRNSFNPSTISNSSDNRDLTIRYPNDYYIK